MLSSFRRWWVGWSDRPRVAQPGLPSLPWEVLCVIASYTEDTKTMVSMFSTCASLWIKYAHSDANGDALRMLWSKCLLSHFPVMNVSEESVRGGMRLEEEEEQFNIVRKEVEEIRLINWCALYRQCHYEYHTDGGVVGCVLMQDEESKTISIYSRLDDYKSHGSSWCLDCLHVPLRKRFKIIILAQVKGPLQLPQRKVMSLFSPLLRGIGNIGTWLGLSGMLGVWDPTHHDQYYNPYANEYTNWSDEQNNHSNTNSADNNMFRWISNYNFNIYAFHSKPCNVYQHLMTIDAPQNYITFHRAIIGEALGYFAYDLYFSLAPLYLSVPHSKYWKHGPHVFTSKWAEWANSRKIPQVRVIMKVEEK